MNENNCPISRKKIRSLANRHIKKKFPCTLDFIKSLSYKDHNYWFYSYLMEGHKKDGSYVYIRQQIYVVQTPGGESDYKWSSIPYDATINPEEVAIQDEKDRAQKIKNMKKQSYDLIGDIHGQAPELVRLLEKLSYLNVDGVWQHAERKVIFLGDFVDRGDHQREVIGIVRPMIERGHALSVMGNHEYNAIAYYTKNDKGDYLRSHNDKHTKQHQKFLSAYEGDIAEKEEVIKWFKTLPLWLDLAGLRVVHACWDFNLISKIGKPILTDDLLQQSAIKDTWQYDAIETLLKGKEIPLPNGQSFLDKDGNPRKHIRTRWWDRQAKTYKQVFFGPDDALTHIPDDPISGDHLIDYAKDDKPVFLGHYWMKGDIQPLAENIACLDYSVADAKDPNARLVAYRWDGEQKIDTNKFLFVDRK